MTDISKGRENTTLEVTAPQVQIRDWYTPTELKTANFSDNVIASEAKQSLYANNRVPHAETASPQVPRNDMPPPHEKPSGDSPPYEKPNDAPPKHNDSPPKQEYQKNEKLLDRLLPLIGKLNNGALDITTVLDLFDKSGQGLGALGKLLPIITPLLSGFGGGFKKKSTEDTVDLKTINLDT